MGLLWWTDVPGQVSQGDLASGRMPQQPQGRSRLVRMAWNGRALSDQRTIVCFSRFSAATLSKWPVSS
jgi:hypothetical protein